MSNNKRIQDFEEAESLQDNDFFIISRNGEENFKVEKNKVGKLNYADFEDKPTLDTTSSNSLPIGNETIVEAIKLHKISKTGSYNDLNDKPAIPSKLADLSDGTSTVTNLQNAINAETSAREQDTSTLQDNIDTETTNREEAMTTLETELNEEINDTNNIMDGVHAIELNGAFLSTDVKEGITHVEKNLFPASTVFVTYKTLIHDDAGTIGVYISDVDSAVINVRTMSISASDSEAVRHANVETHADLPLTISAAETIGWATPKVSDYTVVDTDETMDSKMIEWFITAIDTNGNITWGNPRPLNDGDYQEQTSSDWAGKVMIAGSVSGRWGTPKDIDVTPTENSNNLISSDAVFQGLAEKQDTITGGASTIANNNLAINKTLISDANGKVSSSNVTNTELGYLSGVTSAVQNQLNANKYKALSAGETSTVTSFKDAVFLKPGSWFFLADETPDDGPMQEPQYGAIGCNLKTEQILPETEGFQNAETYVLTLTFSGFTSDYQASRYKMTAFYPDGSNQWYYTAWEKENLGLDYLVVDSW